MLSSKLTAATLGVALAIGIAVSAAAQDGRPTPQARPAKAGEIDLAKLTANYADPTVPNIAGFWRPDRDDPMERFFLLDGTQLPMRKDDGQDGFPYRPAWQKAYEARRQGHRDGVPYGDPSAACWPNGLYKNYVGYHAPVEITQTPGRVFMMFERTSPVRRIFTDGRDHLKGDALIHTAQGDSIGHWEGKTLVVDTIGLRREFTLSSSPGMPHSEQLHVTERFTRLDATTLQIEVILDDPKAFTQPVKNTLIYKRWVDDGIMEDLCIDNNRSLPDENLVVTLDLKQRKHYGFDLPE